MEIKPNFDEVFYLTLPATPPHTAELGAWDPRAGSEIRYRAKWPGKDQGVDRTPPAEQQGRTS